MPLGSGKHTTEFGRWLTQHLLRNTVYYDRGDSLAEENVAAIHGFYGSEVSNITRLADEADVIVASPHGELLLVIEIEEGAISPKKLLGDLMAILMCNGFAVATDGGHRTFTITPNTQFILAGVVSPRGSKALKIEEVIAPRRGETGRLSGGIDPANVSLVFERVSQISIGVVRDRVRRMLK
jgi:hypothetical protein